MVEIVVAIVALSSIIVVAVHTNLIWRRGELKVVNVRGMVETAGRRVVRITIFRIVIIFRAISEVNARIITCLPIVPAVMDGRWTVTKPTSVQV